MVERMVSCEYQRGQIQTRLADIRKQTSALPRVFPWPGLGERRQAVEQARALLDRSAATAPVLSALRTEVTSERFKARECGERDACSPAESPTDFKVPVNSCRLPSCLRPHWNPTGRIRPGPPRRSPSPLCSKSSP